MTFSLGTQLSFFDQTNCYVSHNKWQNHITKYHLKVKTWNHIMRKLRKKTNKTCDFSKWRTCTVKLIIQNFIMIKQVDFRIINRTGCWMYYPVYFPSITRLNKYAWGYCKHVTCSWVRISRTLSYCKSVLYVVNILVNWSPIYNIGYEWFIFIWWCFWEF